MGLGLGELCVRHPDLLRLQRLHRYCHRLRTALRAAYDAEFCVSLFCIEHPGFLEEVAHFPVELVPRVPVYTVGGESGWQFPARFQCVHCFCREWTVAWREL